MASSSSEVRGFNQALALIEGAARGHRSVADDQDIPKRDRNAASVRAGALESAVRDLKEHRSRWLLVEGDR